MLQSDEVAEVILAAALSVEAGVSHVTQSGVDIPTETDSYTTDRAAASVTLAHPAGRAVEAKHGVLAKAAAAAGLEIKAGSDNDIVDYVRKDGTKRKATRAQARNWSGGTQG